LADKTWLDPGRDTIHLGRLESVLMLEVLVLKKDKQEHSIIAGQLVSAAKLQRAKELRQQMTSEEKILWQHLRTNRLNGLHFRRQQIIDGFIVDFYCHKARLVIEVDGEIHQQQTDYDAARDTVLAARGLRVIRIRNEEVRNTLEEVLERIIKACDLTP
jgi:very-short-patch-repair endonuclease